MKFSRPTRTISDINRLAAAQVRQRDLNEVSSGLEAGGVTPTLDTLHPGLPKLSAWS